MKKVLFTLLFVAVTLTLRAQSNPLNEILVYFSSGVTQDSLIHKGEYRKIARITSTELANSLMKFEIDESTIDVAMPKFNKSDTLTILSDGSRLHQPDMTKLFRIKVKQSDNSNNILRMLNSLPEVAYAERNAISIPCMEPNDQKFIEGEQWNLKNEVFIGNDIHATQAWDVYTGNPNSIIAILDAGFDYHFDLDAKVIGGYDADYGWNAHANKVAGIAAAESNNGAGISGVDWNAKVISKRVDADGITDDYEAIVDAVNYSPNVKVLNNSWNTGGGKDMYGRDIPGDYSVTLGLACAYAYKANRTVVAAVGDYEEYLPGVPVYPAAYDNVIAVGASTNTEDEIIWEKSSSGPHINVVAPGEDIYTYPLYQIRLSNLILCA